VVNSLTEFTGSLFSALLASHRDALTQPAELVCAENKKQGFIASLSWLAGLDEYYRRAWYFENRLFGWDR